MPKKRSSIAEILNMLHTSPAQIGEAARGVNPDILRRSPARGEWSANDVLAHLRACADVWGGCIARILDEDEPTIVAVNPKTWIRNTNYKNLAFGESFDAFHAQRIALLARLELIPVDSWQRGALVTGAGRPRVHTIQDYGHRLANHERIHVRQIERAIEAAQG